RYGSGVVDLGGVPRAHVLGARAGGLARLAVPPAQRRHLRRIDARKVYAAPVRALELVVCPTSPPLTRGSSVQHFVPTLGSSARTTRTRRSRTGIFSSSPPAWAGPPRGRLPPPSPSIPSPPRPAIRPRASPPLRTGPARRCEQCRAPMPPWK